MSGALSRISLALDGRYRIERELGAGGMATVYLAHDLKHDRQVAVKVLKPELGAVLGVERFLSEIRVTANLQHPNLLPLFDSGAAEGLLYYVMPYIEGETLRARLEREQQLAVDEGMRLVGLMAGALDFAHVRGVVHRDLKPENVLLQAGQPVIADFGIALAVAEAGGARVTQTGMSLGTPRYMSPEQAAGDRAVDARSDQYSLGALTYEMLTGEPPHTGATSQVVIARLMTETPRSIRSARPAVPAAVDAAVLRALSKSPADRFSSCGQFASALRATERSTVADADAMAMGPASMQPRTTRSTPWVVVAVLALLVAGALAWGTSRASRSERGALATTGIAPRSTVVATQPSLAVLPLVNVGGDTAMDYFADGMTDELTSALGKVPGLRVAARSSAFAFKGRLGDVRQVAASLHVAHVLEGSVRRAGGRVRVTAQLVNAADGLALWSDSYDGRAKDVFAVQDSIAHAIANALRLAVMAPSGRGPVLAVNPEVHDLYLKGRFLFHSRASIAELRRSVDLYREALRLDSTYAPAWAGIADTWIALSDDYVPPREANPKAKFAAEKAIALDSTLGDAYAVLGTVLGGYEWDFPASERALLQALRLAPNDVDVLVSYAFLLEAMGRNREAYSTYLKARTLDPLVPWITCRAAYALALAGEHARAVTECERALRADPDHAWNFHAMGDIYLIAGKPAEALAAHQRARTLDPAYRGAGVGQALAVLGRRDEARRFARELTLESQRAYIRPENIAVVYAALGDRDSAFLWLDRAFETRSAGIAMIRTDPAWDSIRADPRFAALLKRMGLR